MLCVEYRSTRYIKVGRKESAGTSFGGASEQQMASILFINAQGVVQEIRILAVQV